MIMSLNITSWNIKGLGHPIKRHKILDHLRKHNTSIALLQETHLNEAESKKLKRDWVADVVFSPAKGKKME